MSRIAHVTTVHPRFDTRIFRKECVTLSGAGYETYLVVADGKGHGAKDGIQIRDVGSTSGRLKRMVLLPFRAMAELRSLKPDVVHFHDPELLPMGLLLKLLGYRVIYDAHEDLPRAILSKHWINPGLRRVIAGLSEWVEDFCARRLSAVVTATPHIAKRFMRVNPKTVSITNYPVLDENSQTLERNPEEKTFFYAGAISRKRAAREMVLAIDKADARLLLAGPFEDPQLRAELEKMPEWERVTYLGFVDHNELWALMARSLAGLLLFHPEPNHINSVPNKMFEYMAGCLPIICSDFEDWRQIIVDNQIGLTCDPEDVNSISTRLLWILNNRDEAERMGAKGRKIVTEQYRWQNEAEKLVSLYQNTLA